MFGNYIDGKWEGEASGGMFENRNPARWDDVVGVFPNSGKAEIERAVAAAKQAFPAWSRVPAPERGNILKRVGDLLLTRKEALAQLMTREMGKVLLETRGDVQEAIDTAYYFASEGRRLYGETTPSELPNKFCATVRMPVGVCGMITPWNFPLAIPAWKIFPALLCGNTVVFKPGEDTPASAVKLMEILLEAGVPKGVVNLVCGDGPSAGEPLVEHPDVALISFTGSSETGKLVAGIAGKGLKRSSLEMGGKNAQITMEDANLDLAMEGVLWGAFGTTGQRCTATSRLILHEKIAASFTEALVEKAKALRLGNGLDPASQVGPFINAKQRDRAHAYVKIGQEEGAKLLCGGKFYEAGECQKGFFYEPTVFTDVQPGMRIAQEEIFGPVVAVMMVKSFEEAVEILNGTPYGLSSSIYTQDVDRAFRAIRDLQAGITYINGPTIGAEVHLPFGGMKQTGNGHREAGKAVLDIFTEWKTVYVDYSGHLQRAQIDNQYPI